MENKFKEYLIDQFRQIAPTKSAMEYRKKILKQLLDRAQELKIKGMTDEDFIYNLCIEELGDFHQTLIDFEKQEIKTKDVKRNSIIAVCVVATVVMLLVISFLVVSSVTKLWHPMWLILVGGILLTLVFVSGFYIFDKKQNHPNIKRLLIAIDITLLTVFIFLLLQIGINIKKAWQAFLILPILLFVVDTTLAFVFDSKIRWFELPVAIEVFSVMLFVIVGINVPSFWHPGWILCLVGPLAMLIEISVFVAKKQREKKLKEDKANFDKYENQDEHYYTSWDD